MRKNPAYGVECVYNKEEVEKEQHLTGDFEYVLEGMAGTSFGAACTGEVLVKPDNSDYKFSVASHGHLPTRPTACIYDSRTGREERGSDPQTADHRRGTYVCKDFRVRSARCKRYGFKRNFKINSYKEEKGRYVL